MERITDNAVDLAWLHYVGGLTQAEIAKQRGLSTATVHRMLRAAHERGAVRVLVQERPAATVELEQEVIRAFGLQSCRLVPPIVVDPDGVRDGAGMLAVQELLFLLESRNDLLLGVGAGRTLAAVARAFPRVRYERAEFVSLTGDFSVFRVGHSTDVLRRLADRTGGTAYSIAAPILADSQADREVLISQSGTRIAFQKIAAATHNIVGIGHVGPNSFLLAFDLVTEAEVLDLTARGVVADFCGHLLDHNGEPVDCDIGRRLLSCSLDALAGKTNIAVAFGSDKVAAILAVLRTGLLTSLVSDWATARALLDQMR